MELHIERRGVVVPVPVDPLGIDGPTPGRARGPRWRRTPGAGLFVPSDVPADDEFQRIVEAVAGAPEGSGATGWAALHWQRARWFTGRTARGDPLPVPLAIGDTVHLAPRAGVQLHRDWLFDGDIVHVDGLPITRAERSICTAALRATSLEDTLRIICMAMADDLASLSEIRSYAARIKGRPHTRRLNEAIDLSDENIWSPQEVTLLTRWRQQRPGRSPRCNPPIFDGLGNHLFTPDLLDAEAGVVGQYDGVIHERTQVRRRDLDVEELCRDLGLEVVTMLSRDLRDLRSFDRRLAAAYERAARRCREHPHRAWTLDQPWWWTDTSTVAARRALDDEDRRIWLRRQVA
ncbi:MULTISPECIES: hypothetical protein [unclassified Nocardioides]|uniref:hypothetical protein n=1 Tax=unclassified Nocardioides TaxID=2615069 RepID=UPI00114FDBA1|nr:MULTISPECIES: hypothetical protein [unclassified Nocardioides]WGY00582.1 hypothetical protein QI633_18795 [Nocardioides sp. QY071]